MALEKVIRDAAVNVGGTIFYKSVQILAYADDIDIIGRTPAMTEAFTSLEKAAKDMNLFINQEKTKYMLVTRKSHASYPHYLEVGPYKFQVVHSFAYLGSDVNCNNDINAEIQKRFLAANRCFHGLRKHLTSHLTSKTLKYWCIKYLLGLYLQMLPKHGLCLKQMSLFERKLLQCISGAKQGNKNGGKDTTVNCTKHLMNQTLSITSKSKISMGRAFDAYE